MNLEYFTANNIRQDALAGTITGMVAVPLTIGICLMSEYPIQTGLITVIFACIVGFISFLFLISKNLPLAYFPVPKTGV